MDYEADRYEKPPRINSTYDYGTFSDILYITRHLNFNNSRFNGRHKRANSWGSTQAFIVELALTIPAFREYLLQFFVRSDKTENHLMWMTAPNRVKNPYADEKIIPFHRIAKRHYDLPKK